MESIYEKCVEGAFIRMKTDEDQVVRYLSDTLLPAGDYRELMVNDMLPVREGAVPVTLECSDGVTIVVDRSELMDCDCNAVHVALDSHSRDVLRAIVAITERTYVLGSEAVLKVFRQLELKKGLLHTLLPPDNDFKSYEEYLSTSNDKNLIPDLYRRRDLTPEETRSRLLRRIVCTAFKTVTGEYNWSPLMTQIPREDDALYRLVIGHDSINLYDLPQLTIRHLSKEETIGLHHLQQENSKYDVVDSIMEVVIRVVERSNLKSANTILRWATTNFYGSWSSRSLAKFNSSISTDELIESCSSKKAFKRSDVYFQDWIRDIADYMKAKSTVKDSDHLWDGCPLTYKDIRQPASSS